MRKLTELSYTNEQFHLCSLVIISPGSWYPFTSPQASLVSLAFTSGTMPFGPHALGIWSLCVRISVCVCVCVTGSETGRALCHQHSSSLCTGSHIAKRFTHTSLHLAGCVCVCVWACVAAGLSKLQAQTHKHSSRDTNSFLAWPATSPTHVNKLRRILVANWEMCRRRSGLAPSN